MLYTFIHIVLQNHSTCQLSAMDTTRPKATPVFRGCAVAAPGQSHRWLRQAEKTCLPRSKMKETIGKP